MTSFEASLVNLVTPSPNEAGCGRFELPLVYYCSFHAKCKIYTDFYALDFFVLRDLVLSLINKFRQRKSSVEVYY